MASSPLPHSRTFRIGSSRRVVILCAATGWCLLLADGALAAPVSSRLAYVDPGAGSFILQALVAMFAGAVVAVNAYWSRIKRFLGLASPDDANGEEKPAARPDDG